MKKQLIILLAIVCTILIAETEVKNEYWIKVNSNPLELSNIEVQIETNIPDSPTLSISLSLRGQKPNDTFIGTRFTKVTVTDGKTNFMLDATKETLPLGAKLPNGEYDVEVSFHPRWVENRELSKKYQINESIEAKDIINLTTSNQSAKEAQFKADGRRWLMNNFYMNYPWKPEFWENKFGELEHIEYRGNLSSKIVKMYYIKSIDVTLLVNIIKNEVVTYRIGLVHE